MPDAALRPCSGDPRCPELTKGGPCPKHLKLRQKASDANRGTAQQRGYTYKWSLKSQQHLRQYPLCGMKDECAYEGWRGECYEQGRVTPATCTDHIIPHKGDKLLFWDPLNRCSMCDSCHSKKTAMEDGGFGHNPANASSRGLGRGRGLGQTDDSETASPNLARRIT